MKDIWEFMKVCTLKFGWINKEDLGYFDYDKCEVKLNVALLLAEVFIHEQIHSQFPKDTEIQVIKKTSKKLNKLTKKEILEIGKFICLACLEELKVFLKNC